MIQNMILLMNSINWNDTKHAVKILFGYRSEAVVGIYVAYRVLSFLTYNVDLEIESRHDGPSL